MGLNCRLEGPKLIFKTDDRCLEGALPTRAGATHTGVRYPLGRRATHTETEFKKCFLAPRFDSNRLQQLANKFLSLLSGFLAWSCCLQV